jgi:hypothetical protein
MSIASVVTRGYSQGVNFLPTRGYLSGNAPVTVEDIGGIPSSYSYFPQYHKQEEKQKSEIRKSKTDLQKIDSVLVEYERRKALADESLLLAEESENQRLLTLQNQLIAEISRLLMVKAELMARVRRGEEQLILMIAMRRKRLRAF